MGLQLSPVMINMYMKYFKEVALGTVPHHMAKKQINTFILLPHQETVQILTDHVHLKRPLISM